MVSNNYSMVQVNGLSVWMGRRPILRDINLAVSPGESIAIMGPNGAGKSTLLLCLAGVIRPTLGRICCFREATPRSSTAKRLTGFAGHQSGLYGDLTALENLTFAARMYEIDDPINKAHASLSEAGIGPQAGYRVAQLSQGARQRLAIIRSAIHQPFLILLDEPFASLDADGSQWLQLLFQRWRDTERTVCFVSHDIEKSRRLADRIVWLDAGHITSIDECKTMFSHSLSVA